MNAIGLFGGTFDPIHNGHLHIARAFADETGLDSVIFLPAGDPYHKAGSRTPAHHRLAMTELAAAADSRFAVSDCDIVRSGATYTADTVDIFRQHFPGSRLYWLLGMDSLLQLHTWKRWRELVRHTCMVAAVRPGARMAELPAPLRDWAAQAIHDGSLRLLHAAPDPNASSDIRHRLLNGQSVADCLPEAVAAYIDRHGLYRP